MNITNFSKKEEAFFVISMTPTGIQKSLLVSKQTSIESGYNIFDEVIWKTGSQCLGTGMTAVLRHTAIHSRYLLA
ncbi:hypothetical protein [Wolbachia endosymbiont (group A) of Pogonocherus hispidulus]|uniref:hypothetical protein n=1 Tax=Wolbachia endosymbiont (group A) of Pogonocherus hispidulus TaxID=3066136 RepID=UPI00333E8CFF